MTETDKYKGLYLCEQIKGLGMMLDAARAAYHAHAKEVVTRLYPNAAPDANVGIDFSTGEVTLQDDGTGVTANSQQADARAVDRLRKSKA